MPLHQYLVWLFTGFACYHPHETLVSAAVGRMTMSYNSRDQLWNAVFETYYDSYYAENLSDALIDRWQVVDETTKVLVALTASTSAIAGWALWSQPVGKFIWVTLAGTGAVLAIIHSTLGVPGRLKNLSDTQRLFASLRIDLETFRHRMGVDPEFPVEEFTERFIEYRRRYGEASQTIRNDILKTKRLRIGVQIDLNTRIADKLLPQQGS